MFGSVREISHATSIWFRANFGSNYSIKIHIENLEQLQLENAVVSSTGTNNG